MLWASAIVDELARSGVRDAVIAPGSRSAPLALAFAAHPDIRDHSVIDERNAAFMALGLAKGGERPVAVLCTSGTAAANFFPAVCEADLSAVPLLLCTADRPVELRDSGAAQTMDQFALFGTHVRHFAQLPEATADASALRALRAAVCHAVARATMVLPGPVQLNIPFRKPLEPSEAVLERDQLPAAWSDAAFEAAHGRASGRAWTRYRERHAPDLVGEIGAELLAARRPLLIAGPMAGTGHRAALRRFARRFNLPVLAEAASNLRFGEDGDMYLSTADIILRNNELRTQLRPDLLLHIGGAATSSVMQRFIEELPDCPFITIGGAQRADPAHRCTLHALGDTATLLLDVLHALDSDGLHAEAAIDAGWIELLRAADAGARSALRERLDSSDELFEGKAVRAFTALLPEGTPLFVSSSMPIRDIETFVDTAPRDVELFFNRGVNGIDGILSTALGVAAARGVRCALIVGDVATLHNLNALCGAALSELPLLVLLLNNNGGEIFELLPVRDFDPAFTRHFLTPHGVDIAAALVACGAQHRRVNAWSDLPEAVAEGLSHRGVYVLELRSDIRASGAFRRALLHDLAARVPAAALPEMRAVPPPLVFRRSGGGSGTPVLLLHGFTRSMDMWNALSLDDKRVILRCDLPGHGASPSPDVALHPEYHTLEHTAERIEELLTRLSLPRVHLVGYSLGARCAMMYARHAPQRLASLTLVSGSPGMEDEALRARRRHDDAALAESIASEGLHRFVEHWTSMALLARNDASNASSRERLRQCSRGLAASLLGAGQGRQPALWDALAALDLPLLAVAGERDTAYVEHARRLEREAGATARIIPHCGHDVPVEQPEALSTALREFWKRVDDAHC